MMQKGNILQYKNNSSCFTKKQIYSLMAQKKWTNRNTTWATQNDKGYTNPNVKMLKRNDAINITTSGIETLLPITCPSNPSVQTNALPLVEPSQGSDDGPSPELPPVEPETGNSGTVLPSTPNEDPIVEPIVIRDLGTLSCNIVENPCTSYTETKQTNQLYHPTSDSDVPGRVELLYWDENTQTWYPRQQRVMNTSDNKWPNTTGLPDDPTYIAATAYP